jgi:uridylate kinase
MHAPVDHAALKVILQNKLKVFVIGKDARQLDNLLNGKAFIGSVID